MAAAGRTAKAPPFPLWFHTGKGLWAKKIRGRMVYFGRDKDSALAEYVRVKADLEAGRVPRPKADDDLTLRDLVNRFLTERRARVESGELTAGTWSQYYRTAEQLVESFGPGRAVADLRSEDFARLRAVVARRLGPRALGQFITLTRTILAFAFDSDLIDRPVRYGSSFDRPPKRLVRLARERRGPLLVEAVDLRRMIASADPQVRAWIYLGINCGFASSDVSRLNRAELRKKPGWLTVGRVKTGTPRRCPLWPETTAAIEAVAAVRPQPRDPADADAVFLTPAGRRWVRVDDRSVDGKVSNRRDSLGTAFQRLAESCGVRLNGRFGVLRHCFRTVADGAKDLPATRLVMGHADHAIDDWYRERIDDGRLIAVSEFVRQWLWGDPPG
jgi:integrase